MSKRESSTAALDTTADKYDRLLSRFATSGFPPLIIAVGLSDHLLDALDRHDASSRILAVEPVPARTRDAIGRPQWRSWIESGRLTVLVGPDYKGYADAWRLISKDALQPPMIVDPGLLQEFPSQTEGAKAVAKQIVRGARANEEARQRFAGGYLLNTLTNLPVIASEADASALCDAFTDVPAIVVGAGPSLDANLSALHDLQDRALLIAVDTAVRPLLAAGIQPHLVVSVDPSEANARHLNDLPDVRGLWFVGEGSLTPSVFPQFSGRTFVYKVSHHDPWPWLAELSAERATLQTWGSVLTTAFDVARRAGCDPIVFAGSDLAYTDGLQYCRNTVYEPDWSPFPTDAERAAEFARYLETKPHLKQRDIDGREVTTAPHFIQFRDWIVAQAETATPRRIINGTGAGILYGGVVENLNLEFLAFAPLSRAKCDLRARLASAWTTSTIGHGEVLRNLERAIDYGVAIPLQQWHEFGGNTTTLDQIRETLRAVAARLAVDRRNAAYLEQHRDSYDRRIKTAEDARELSHGNYAAAAARATAQQTHVFLDFLQRTYEARRSDLDSVLEAMVTTPRSVRALDVGCGAGRSMEPLVDFGARVDGVDISERMIHFARDNSKLTGSSFFLSRGNDCGKAVDGAYDLVYSQLCFRYIRSRTVRNELLRAMARALRPGGVVVIEMRFFRGYTAATIPPPHVPWSADSCDTTVEAGAADVCPTPDELHLVYDDFSRHFEDLRFQFVEVAPAVRDRLPLQLFVSGSIRGELASRVHAVEPSDQIEHQQ
jgi:SAM-dependent methyltransferase